MGNVRDRNIDSARRDDQRAGTIDICIVTHVYPHVRPWPDDPYFNLVDVQLIDRVRDKNTMTAPIVPRIHLKTLLHYHSYLQGEVWNPRIGDAVVVYWIKNREGLVLGQTQTPQQEPVCRSNADDKHQEIVKKICSWPGYPEMNPDGDFVAYPPPQHPDCYKRWPVGSCEECGGEEKQYGDTVYVFDCPNGHNRPYCDTLAPCNCIDDIHQCATYFKYHSAVSPTENELPYRFKFHHHCGSIFYFDDDGTIHLENIIYECGGQTTRQGQIHFFPTGTVMMRSEPETEKAAMVRVVSIDDSEDPVRVEMIDETTGAFVRILKTGEISLYSPEKITLDAPLVEVVHDLQVDEDELVSGVCSGPNNVE